MSERASENNSSTIRSHSLLGKINRRSPASELLADKRHNTGSLTHLPYGLISCSFVNSHHFFCPGELRLWLLLNLTGSAHICHWLSSSFICPPDTRSQSNLFCLSSPSLTSLLLTQNASKPVQGTIASVQNLWSDQHRSAANNVEI